MWGGAVVDYAMKVFLICIAGLVVACLVYLHIQALSWEPSPEQMPWVGIVFGAYFICSTFLKIANGSYNLFRSSTEATSGSEITVYRKTSPVLFWFGIIIWFILGTGILIWSIFLLRYQLN